MDLASYIAFVAASIALIAIPGPNVALICSHVLSHGVRYGLLTVAGIAAAMAVQLAVVVLGTGTLLIYLADWFEALRWLGVLYLLYLGVRSWTADAPARKTDPPHALGRSVMLRGFLVSLTNPHTLLFFAAFLPQFVDPANSALPQLAFLAGTILFLGIVLDSFWALIAARMRRAIAARSRLRNRLTGGLLIGAAIGLALARRVAITP